MSKPFYIPAGDPEVRAVYTFAGDRRDTSYKRQDDGWKAYVARESYDGEDLCLGDTNEDEVWRPLLNKIQQTPRGFRFHKASRP